MDIRTIIVFATFGYARAAVFAQPDRALLNTVTFDIVAKPPPPIDRTRRGISGPALFRKIQLFSEV